MRKLTLVLAMFSCHLCFAAPDEEVVKAVSKTTGLTADEIRADYNACGSGVTIRIKICLNYDFTEQDRRLNSLYKKVRAKAKEEGFEKSLLASQRAWLSYLETNCQLQADAFNGQGTGWGVWYLGCKTTLTRDRANALEEFIKEN
ncbi:MAG: DUF1311 domain-containing protein [Nevskia sp.]|jgi:uncharacterized protein YecT (DUF1311 family)|nr:DUF1311 domain-containing protein [Nevskia sp.]